MLVIDCQCLRGVAGELVIKELAFAKINCDHLECSNSYFFKQPYPSSLLSFKSLQTNRWSIRYLHGIDWKYGQIEYKHLRSILYDITENENVVYVKGTERKRLISEILL